MLDGNAFGKIAYSPSNHWNFIINTANPPIPDYLQLNKYNVRLKYKPVIIKTEIARFTSYSFIILV